MSKCSDETSRPLRSQFSAETFKAWEESFEAFNQEFRFHCFKQFRVFSIGAEFTPGALQQAHQRWVHTCDTWLRQETHPKTRVLSHTKRAALLLHALTSVEYLGTFHEHQYDEIPKFTFRGTDEEFRQARQDLIDGGQAVLALDFVLNIIDYFERHRTDRMSPYTVRLTRDMRHDLLNYLLSGKAEEKALFLILKALFLRHPMT